MAQNADGTYVYAVMTEDAETLNVTYSGLKTALDEATAGQTIEVVGSTTYDGDLVVINGVTLKVNEGLTLTVTGDVTVENGGKLILDASTLAVGEAGENGAEGSENVVTVAGELDASEAVGITAVDGAKSVNIYSTGKITSATAIGGGVVKMNAAYYNDGEFVYTSLANAVTTNHAGATGDGITMGEAVGADTVDMEQIQLHPTVYQENGLLVSESVRSMGGILVNSEGKRFCNDLATRDAVSNAELEQPGSYAYIIFDQRVVDNLASTQKYIKNGLTVQADTYEGLAEAMGLTGDAVTNFVDTMNTWNASVAAGVDEEFGRNNGMEEDLSTAPYYAIKIAPGIHHTMGGLKINTDTQVISTEGQAISGLYAAGETTGGVHGGNRIGGNAVCDFVVFGRIAGQNAAAFAQAN